MTVHSFFTPLLCAADAVMYSVMRLSPFHGLVTAASPASFYAPKTPKLRNEPKSKNTLTNCQSVTNNQNSIFLFPKTNPNSHPPVLADGKVRQDQASIFGKLFFDLSETFNYQNINSTSKTNIL
jgi:hypothetical protein